MDYIETLKHKRIAVLGLGVTGLGIVRFLHAHRIEPVLVDSRETPPTLPWLLSQVPHLSRFFGDLDAANLASFDIILISPGLSPALAQIVHAQQAGVEVFGDVELFARVNTKPVFAVTGSNGKSTVVTLLTRVLETGGYHVGLGGNIGTSVLDLLAQQADMYVLELSSFQLESVSSLQPASACILNISEDHMDRYADLNSYIAAKQRIYQRAEQCVFNQQDSQTTPQQLDTKTSLSFGLHQGDYHMLAQNGQAYFAYQGKAIISTEGVKLAGSHNLLNMLAIMAMCHQLNLDEGVYKRAFSQFKGLEHRCQYVTTQNKVRFYNDSKATNVGATIAALTGFSQESGNLILIAGGDAKGADLSQLTPYLNQHVAHLICLGKDGETLAALKAGSVVVDSMSAAVKEAKTYAKQGDIVLLAPACASLDMYASYMARGDDFIECVMEASC